MVTCPPILSFSEALGAPAAVPWWWRGARPARSPTCRELPRGQDRRQMWALVSRRAVWPEGCGEPLGRIPWGAWPQGPLTSASKSLPGPSRIEVNAGHCHRCNSIWQPSRVQICPARPALFPLGKPIPGEAQRGPPTRAAARPTHRRPRLPSCRRGVRGCSKAWRPSGQTSQDSSYD